MSKTEKAKSTNSKFFSTLTSSHQGIREQRAKALTTLTKNAQQALVRQKEDELTNIEIDIDKLGDLGPESTTSLKNKEIDHKEWVRKMQDLKVRRFMAQRELEFAQETLVEWFN